MKIYIASDHAGFELKEKIKTQLLEMGHSVEDCGAFEFNPQDDYPDFCSVAAKKVAQNPESLGIVLGKSGAGEAIVANKIKSIRAFQAINNENVRLAREHNNANVMSIGSDFIDENNLQEILNTFIKTPFSGEERHIRRIDKIRQIENE